MLIDKSLSIKDGLLLHKNIEPLCDTHIEELREIERLDVTGFTEADVRAEIIDPIVRILGYKKISFHQLIGRSILVFLEKKVNILIMPLLFGKKTFGL